CVGLALQRLRQRDLRGGRLDRLVRDHLPAPERLVVAGHAVDRDPHVGVVGIALLGRRSERHLERGEDDVLGDVLLPRQRVGLQQQFPPEIHRHPSYASGTRRARSIAPRSNSTLSPSTSRVARLPSTLCNVPTKRRRPVASGFCMRTSTRLPAKRAKSAGLRSGRARPGEEISSRSYSTPSTAKTRDKWRLVEAQSSIVIPPGLSMKMRSSRPPFERCRSTSSNPIPRSVGSKMSSSALIVPACLA